MRAARESAVLGMFSEATRAWFSTALGEPTEVQARAWEAIARGENALVIAPTGSGKTLAAFLWAIDALMAEKARDRKSTPLNSSHSLLSRLQSTG